jgi:hypothetical protein
MGRAFGVAFILLLTAVPAWAQLDRMLEGLGLGRQSGLSDSKVASGLKEALKVGTENAVGLTGRTDGYFRNAAIKILMPKALRNLEQPLRAIGYGPQIDEFVLSAMRSSSSSRGSESLVKGGLKWRIDRSGFSQGSYWWRSLPRCRAVRLH